MTNTLSCVLCNFDQNDLVSKFFIDFIFVIGDEVAGPVTEDSVKDLDFDDKKRGAVKRKKHVENNEKNDKVRTKKKNEYHSKKKHGRNLSKLKKV